MGGGGDFYKFLPSSHRVCRAAYNVELCLYCSDNNCSVVRIVASDPAGPDNFFVTETTPNSSSIVYSPKPHQPRNFPFPKKVWEKQF